MAKTGRELPVVDGDLNPEFTGCFSLRHNLRLENRRVETRLLEAEKWVALAGMDRKAALEDAWWELAYVQFHDVFTGSHPTEVYNDVMRVLGEIGAVAEAALTDALAAIALDSTGALPAQTQSVSAALFNGLPWDRADIAELALPSGWEGVARVTDSAGNIRPFAVEDGRVRVLVETPAVGYDEIVLEPRATSGATATSSVDSAILENEWVRVEFDTENGIGKLVWKPTGAVLLENAGSWLLVQRDDGSFQIENPSGAEVAAASGTIRIEEVMSSPLGQSVRLSGEFPPLRWVKGPHHLRWEAEFFLPTHEPVLRLALNLDWHGESTRIRLTLPTSIDSATGIYEVPFGVVRRKPYSPRVNAKGEWPAHRFVSQEDTRHGIALINTGVGGVEVSGGTIYTTLLRSPVAQYAGMVADKTSSQHGTHSYTFAIAPYAGSWQESGVARFAQQINNPIHVQATSGAAPPRNRASLLRLEPENVVLSGIKAASDGSGDVIVRVYETTGKETEAVLSVSETLAEAESICTCDLRETPQAELTVDKQRAIRFTLQPFQIQTLRFRRTSHRKGAL